MVETKTRMTRQRSVILEELRKVTNHPTADEIYSIVRERLPRISLGTVYRNLDFLAESGEILKLEAAGTTKRFDGNTAWHQHVRCTHCGRIGDVMTPQSPPGFAGIHVHGFIVTGARVEYDGVCAHCSGENRPVGHAASHVLAS